ncbi:MAG: efflux RND transporter periplasmic adaptor subunit [Chromatiaceae bacterium]|nr:efflux RND transporter periplasmic adaptor subunit [Gammaproteobacteria bacterium]MCP5303898.1 efflux RND transporter periplasmic adaptor subunit [Chromatiaceae bacterium]MCP5313625.1 efflux RND transporter periplasmic adaptor subunit [Chromatiaceae bacterium]
MGKRPLLVIPIVLAVAGAAAYFWQQERAVGEEVTELTLYGNVDLREVDLAFNAAEHVAEVMVNEGDAVVAGQVLARLHGDKLQAAVDAAQANVDAATQALAKLKAGSRPQEIRIAQAQADALQAKAHSARISYARLRKLETQKLAAPEDVDQAKATADAAEAEARAAQETFALAVAGPRVEDIAQADAQLAARQAELALARQQLDDATLRAPAAGVVRDRILEPGDMAAPQTPVLTLALTEPLWVRVYVPEPQLGRIAPGMRARVITDSYPGKVYDGWIGFISPTAEFTPKNVETTELRTRLVYQARVFVCDPQGELRLGMPATVSVPLEQARPSDDAPPCRDA